MEKTETTKEISKRKEKKEFTCSICGTSFTYERYGKCKDTKANLCILEDVFSMKDPFSMQSTIPLILGGVCTICSRNICMDTICSLFYTKRFCTDCVKSNAKDFPDEIRRDISKLKR